MANQMKPAEMRDRLSLDAVTPRESQAWVRMKIAPVLARLAETGTYAEDHERAILGEDDWGTIMAARPGTEDWWEPFDLTKPEHVAAAEETLRRGVLTFLDLDREVRDDT